MNLDKKHTVRESSEGYNEWVIQGAQLVLPDRLVRGSLFIKGGTIIHLGGKPHGARASGGKILHARGLYVAPGFIDLQVNGGGGRDFSEASPEATRQAAFYHLQYGTTTLLATLITQSPSGFRRCLQAIAQTRVANLLGCHLEGPFISPYRSGAHPLQEIRQPNPRTWAAISRGFESWIRLITLAPERPGALRLVERLSQSGFIVALGHSDATYEQTTAAFRAGVKLVTHLFNAMRDFHHREPGVVGAALEADVPVSLIVDGVHLHPSVVRWVVRCKGPERVCLVTDAISAVGAGEGRYRLGSQTVIVQDRTARLDDGTLAGSLLTMNAAVRNALEQTGLDLPETVRMATLTPARILGIAERKGQLSEGYDADLVIFDNELNVHYVFLKGELVYARS